MPTPHAGWNVHKSEIERLYICENKTRDEVMNFMKTHYSWNKSATQYSKKFKEWGLKKNLNSIDDQWIARRVEKRKREDNKESEVFVNGIQIHPAKIAKSSYRKGYLTEYSRHGPSPSTPEGYCVATPATPALQISWTTSLPWIRFMHLFHSPGMKNISSDVESFMFNPSRRDRNFRLIESLNTIVPWNKLKHSKHLPSASRLSAALSILMPEIEPGEHDAMSTDLSTSKSGAQVHINVLLYLISNKLNPWDFGVEPYGVSLDRHDEMILRLLKVTGWDDLARLQILVLSREPTAECITETLFAAAFRQGNFDLAKKLLSSGMKHPKRIEYLTCWNEGLITPLQFLCMTGKATYLIDLLLFHGADLNFSNKGNGETALYYALVAGNEAAIRILMDRNAEVNWRCVSRAISRQFYCDGTDSLNEDIIDAYLRQDIADQRHDSKALKEAVGVGNAHIVRRFLANRAMLNGLVELSAGEERYQTTLLGVAAYYGHYQMVQLLLHVDVCVDLDCVWPPYTSPLALAVGRGSLEISEILLNSGAANQRTNRVEEALLESAVRNCNLTLCKMLIDHGAKIAKDNRFPARQLLKALLLAVRRRLVSILDLLINSAARPIDLFKEYPGAILAVAIESGEEVIIEKVVNAGANRVCPGIQAIGNLHSAILLENIGILPSLLHDSGPQLLMAAIFAKNFPLAWFLLERDADMGQSQTVHLCECRTREYIPCKTPLQAAILIGDLDFALALLERGAKATDDALTTALQVDKLDFVLVLLGRGANVTDDALFKVIKDDIGLLTTLLIGFTGSAPAAVSAAVLKASMPSLELLRQANVSLEGEPHEFLYEWNIGDITSMWLSRPTSVLEIAAWSADISLLKFLLEWMASVQMNWSRTSVGRTLTIAILLRKHELMAELMHLDSDLNCDIFIGGQFLLDGLYPDAGVDLSPLQAAVYTQQVPIVRQLLASKGVDVNYLGEGDSRRTALQRAVEQGNMEIANLLLEHGTVVNGPPAYDGSATALQIAAIKGYIGIARRLLDLGADVNQEPAPENGRTALMGAAEHGRLDMLQMLLDEGALVVGDHERYYHEAVALAEGQGHFAAARLLKSFRESVEL